jgi:DNA-binding NtrC family response regulator
LKHKILLIEDDETFYDSIKITMTGCPVEIVWADTGAKGIQKYRQDLYGHSIVIVDYKLPDTNGGDVCRHLKKLNSEQIFLFTSQYFEKEYLTDQLRAGSDGFIDKTTPPEEIRSEILRAISLYEKENRLVSADIFEKTKTQRELEEAGLVGKSEKMHSMLQKLISARDSKYPTLLVGETGSGKELAANVLVAKGKKLVALSCASFISRENLLETELFGYVKGAFTDARADTPGLVMQAHNNVLFLDELHQLSVAAQAKLLRFLQEMRFRRVGDHSGRETTVDFKLVAAVQPDIKQRLQDGRFLPDLIERVGALVVHVPSLRERPEDIELLARKFQDDFNEGKSPSDKKQIRISTINEMGNQHWPTNVRGLQNAVKRMLTNCRSDVVNPKDFREYLQSDLMNASAPQEAQLSLEEARNEFESTAIVKALKGSRTRVEAAARVGIPLTNFLRRLEKFEINADLYLQQT